MDRTYRIDAVTGDSKWIACATIRITCCPAITVMDGSYSDPPIPRPLAGRDAAPLAPPAEHLSRLLPHRPDGGPMSGGIPPYTGPHGDRAFWTDAVSYVLCPRCGVAPVSIAGRPRARHLAPHGDRESLLTKRPDYDARHYQR